MVFEQPPTEPTCIDWARLAAFIDGEGSIYVCKRSNSTHGHRRKVSIANTSVSLICWLGQTFGGSIYISNREPHKPKYVWSMRDRKTAYIIRGVLPYLVIKRREAELLLEFDTTFTDNNGWAVRTIPWIEKKRNDIRKQLRELHCRPVTNNLSPDYPKYSQVV